MPTLTAQLLTAQHEEKKRAWSDYRSIVKRADSAEPEDAARITEVCEILGIELADVEADAVAHKQLPDLIERAKQSDVLEKKLVTVGRKHERAKVALRELTEKKNVEIRELRQEVHGLTTRWTAARTAYEHIERMQAKHWRIFGTPSPMPPPFGPGKNAAKLDSMSVDRWLASEPERILYPHGGDDRTRAMLKVHGYEPGATDGIWIRSDQAEENSHGTRQAPE